MRNVRITLLGYFKKLSYLSYKGSIFLRAKFRCHCLHYYFLSSRISAEYHALKSSQACGKCLIAGSHYCRPLCHDKSNLSSIQ